MASTTRLDMLLVEHNLVSSRTKAQHLIKQGAVCVNGSVITKPATLVAVGSVITVDKGDDYVSRGALKLEGAFLECADYLPQVQGLQCLDIGASTGGFTQVLLRRGAAQVVALDVGHGQLDPRISCDDRVIEMSGVNIRDVYREDLPFAPQMIVSDVSFISLTYVLPVIARIGAPGASIVVLIKPQFEVGRHGLDKHGVVIDESLRKQAIATVQSCAQTCGINIHTIVPSVIEGTHGNKEYLMVASNHE